MDIAADNPFIAAAVAAERLLRCRDVHPFRKLVSIPSAPNTTLAEAIGIRNRLARRPPRVIRPKKWAAMGVPASQAAAEMVIAERMPPHSAACLADKMIAKVIEKESRHPASAMRAGEWRCTMRKVSAQEIIAFGRRRKIAEEKWMLAIIAARTALGGYPTIAT